METNAQTKTEGRKGSLMQKLLLSIVPLVVAAALIIMAVSISSMRTELQDAARRSLQDESTVSVRSIEAWAGRILSEFQMIKSALETV